MLLTIAEASDRLKLSTSAVRGKLNRGKLKGEKRIVNGKEAWFVEIEEASTTINAKVNDWDEFKKSWIKSMTTGTIYKSVISPRIQKLYLDTMEDYFKFLGVAPSLELVTLQGLRMALDEILPNENGCRYSKKHHVYTAWHSCSKLLIKMGKMSKLDALEAREFKPKRFTEAYQPHITGDVLEDLLHVANSWRMGKTYTDVKRLDLGIRLAGYMGLRRSEIVGLKRSDLNATERSLRVLGKGRKYRLLYIPDNVIDALNQWVLETDCWGSPWVFPDRTNDAHITGEALYQQFNKILKHFNGIRAEKKQPPISLHLHGLRHTAVTEWAKDRHSTEDISKWVGHSSPETTRRIYSHLTEEDTFRMMREKLA